MTEQDDIRNVPADELARRNAAAQETIAKAKAQFERMQRARAPLPTGLGDAETVRLLHAGLRERVATSVFKVQTPSPLLMLPCFRDRIPLSDRHVAALITFWNRRAEVMDMQAVERQNCLHAANEE